MKFSNMQMVCYFTGCLSEITQSNGLSRENRELLERATIRQCINGLGMEPTLMTMLARIQ